MLSILSILYPYSFCVVCTQYVNKMHISSMPKMSSVAISQYGLDRSSCFNRSYKAMHGIKQAQKKTCSLNFSFLFSTFYLMVNTCQNLFPYNFVSQQCRNFSYKHKCEMVYCTIILDGNVLICVLMLMG